MEILVATTLFAFTSVALTTLFNYTLRINRKAEALRQASQGMRDFVETIVKSVRNGQIDYGVISGQTVTTAVGPCTPPASSDSGPLNTNDSLVNPVKNNVTNSYNLNTAENRLGILDDTGMRTCYYLGDSTGNYIGSGNAGATLVALKQGGTPQIVNPPNYTVDLLQFIIRPACDPYVTTCKDYGNAAPKIQPFVSIVMKFTTRLPTGEQVQMFYQTSVSTDKYDVPNNP